MREDSCLLQSVKLGALPEKQACWGAYAVIYSQATFQRKICGELGKDAPFGKRGECDEKSK
jgi:hypothetical protein